MKRQRCTYEELKQSQSCVVTYFLRSYSMQQHYDWLQKLESRGLLTDVPVKVSQLSEAEIRRKFTTKNNGTDIRVRGRPNFDGEMNDVLRRYGR